MSIAHLGQGLSLDPQLALWVSSEATIAPSAYLQEEHNRYLQLEDGSFWFQHRNQCIITAVRRFPPTGSILDVGGGNGYVTRGLLDAGFSTTLLEPGLMGAINGRQQRHIPEVICATLLQARFPDTSLDAIGCFDVVEHLADDYGFMEEACRVLKPGGMLYLTLPAYPCLWSLSDAGVGHYRRYTKHTALQLCRRRFDLRYFTYFFSILVLPILLLRSLPFRLGLAKTSELLSDQTEHGLEGGWKLHILNYFLRRELVTLQKGKSRTFGSSCLIVVQKRG